MTLKSTFPRIKEVRTFIIDGVGAGGDYHNVSSSSRSAVFALFWLFLLKKRNGRDEMR
jgi:hypothetical protein